MTALLLLGLPAALALQPDATTYIGIEPARIQRTHVERQARLRRDAAWQGFVSGDGAGWRARFDEWTGLPHRAWGAGIDLGRVVDQDTLELALRRVMAENPDVFGVDASELKVGSAGYVKSTDMWLVRFDQVVPASLSAGDLGEVDGDVVVGARATAGGVPVWRGSVEFRVKGNQLIMFGSKTYPGADKLDVTPSLAAATAIEQAIAEGPAATAQHTVDSADLVILPLMGEDGLELRLTYEVRTRTGGAGDASKRNTDPVGIWVSHVDARTGELINVYNEVRFLSGTVYGTHDLRTVDGNFDTSPMPFLDVTASGGSTTSTDDDGYYALSTGSSLSASLEGDYFRVRNDDGAEGELEWSDGDATWTDDDATQAEIDSFVFLSQVREWSEEYASDISFTTTRMTSNVNLNSTCNAYYDGNVNFYQSGGGCNNTGRIADVNYHEWGHGFHYYNLLAGSWDGSVSEGVGDAVAFMLTGDYVVAPYFATNGSGIRRVDTDYVYPDDVTGEVHQDGLIFAGAVWDLWAELEASEGAAQGYDSLATLFVNGMKAGPTIEESYDEFVAADDDNGDLSDGTPHQCELITAFGFHGLGPGSAEGLLNVEYLPLENQAAAASSYPVTAEIFNAAPECNDAAPVGGTVHYSIDGGESYETAELTLLSEEAVEGAIPAQEPGTIVHYYVTVDNDEGGQVSAPIGGGYINPFSFYVGELTELYRESFEDNDGDYEHELVSGDETEGADDWMHGRPQGYADDPDFAADGSKVWGNDLGGGNFNGEYQDSKHNRLTSVPIEVDPGAYETVIVQFQRWLNVEDGYYDAARVLIDGEVVWSNHGTSSSNGEEHTQDRQWALHTLEVPAEALEDGEFTISWEIESDRGLSFGGWNIDDVAVYGANPSEEESGADGGGADGGGEGGDDGGVGGGGSGDLDGSGDIAVSGCAGCSTSSTSAPPAGALAAFLLALGALVRRRRDA